MQYSRFGWIKDLEVGLGARLALGSLCAVSKLKYKFLQLRVRDRDKQ